MEAKINQKTENIQNKILTISAELYDVLLSLFTTPLSKLQYMTKKKEASSNNDFVYLIWKPGRWLIIFDPYFPVNNTFIPTWRLYSFKTLRFVYDSFTNEEYAKNGKLLYYSGDAKRYCKIFDPIAIQQRIEKIVQYVSNKIFKNDC